MNWIKIIFVSIILFALNCERSAHSDYDLEFVQTNTTCLEGHYGMCFCYIRTNYAVSMTNMSCDDAYTHGLKIRRK